MADEDGVEEVVLDPGERTILIRLEPEETSE
jgi:hypothetical protein